MQFFYWNKNFEVGVPEIDLQHQKLVRIINELAAAIVENRRLPDVRVLFRGLMDYAASHFQSEEQLMEGSPLPEHEKTGHRKAHRYFVEVISETMLRTDLLRSEVSEQVLQFLTTWLISHILGSDLKMVQSLTAKEAAAEGTAPLFGISQVERLLLGALTETEHRFRLIADHAPVLIWVSDATGLRGFFNRAWCDLVGVGEDAVYSRDWSEFIHPEDRAPYQARIAAILIERKPVETEYRLLDCRGLYHWFLERILPNIDANEVLLGLIASATDITDIKRAEDLLSQTNRDLEIEVARRNEQLEQLMLTDALTGIGNRRLLSKRLDDEVLRAQRYQRPMSLVFFDIDLFKRINDSYGHAVGDLALTIVARTLGAGLRECDILCRFGGEEFVALLPETKIEEALGVAQRMRLDVSLIRLPQISETFTISAGLAELAPDENGEQLLQRCDQALYRAKASGRNRCCIGS